MKAMAMVVALLFAGVAEATTVVVTSTPSKAEVFLDGADLQLGTTPCKMDLPEGKHTLRLQKGSRELTHAFEVGSDLVVLKLALPIATYKVDVMFARTTSDTVGWIAVVNGKLTGETVPGTLTLPEGENTLVLLKVGFKDVVLHIDVNEHSSEIRLDAPRKGHSSWARVCYKHFIGTWVKTGPGTTIELKPDMTLLGKKRSGAREHWEGSWALLSTECGVRIDVLKGSMSFVLQGDGTLAATDDAGHRWVLFRR